MRSSLYPIPDILIHYCIDGGLAISQSLFLPLLLYKISKEVARTYSRVFDSLAFLKTSIITGELIKCAARVPENNILWMFAGSMLLRCPSLTFEEGRCDNGMFT